jgi:ABC-2 type transport system permease protein
MLAIIRKELKSYLLTPIGYVFIGLFILMFSVSFFRTIYASNVINFEYLFYNGSTILTFITPILTMRMFAEERKSGTEQLILTSPRSIVSVVLGKFFAAGIILAITSALTLMYFAVLSFFGEPSLRVAITTIFGFILLGMAYVSFGMFASSLTENQIVASILPIGVFILMIFLPSEFSSFSLAQMFDKFPEGLISIGEVVGFLSFQLLFILLTIIVLQRRKCVK